MNKKVKKRMIITVTLIVFHVLGFLSSIHAVMSTRTSQGAIAWVVSLNTFPYVAVPAYWVFGRSTFRGYVTARQTGDLEIQDIVQTASAESADLRSTRGEDRRHPCRRACWPRCPPCGATRWSC